jgi:hypothetical protein
MTGPKNPVIIDFKQPRSETYGTCGKDFDKWYDDVTKEHQKLKRLFRESSS